MKKESAKEEKRVFQGKGRVGVVVNYPVGDFLIRIKNAAKAKRSEVEVVSNKLIKAVAQVLKEEGFLHDFSEEGERLIARLAYRKKEPVILDLILVSKPGLRIYMGVDELKKIRRPSLFIISNSKGVMSSRQALKERLGGEIIAEVF